jgi:hypothetical protein
MFVSTLDQADFTASEERNAQLQVSLGSLQARKNQDEFFEILFTVLEQQIQQIVMARLLSTF